ncbi:sulfite exporter TauE/SafE family protein [Aestuariirhabdus litorea]|uniref:Sulfite exporter TauE/SafE family protein n=1 Tax=Aestuariirhabdus litorea TaxID=2528527 RepID=A0A3P3VP26_9GAMM|nr:sulfite exporter TauE/SafE family protein [Aestuariirhabdus litorea]RRJ84455.1 sulfite exporter TauE/SafE family protein [Aestuariirhabdus litorea]RWW97679.1 sulfite exporter TauE/SafE family protein [Endozoicomonadaceae bacterium GTF-13]
MTDLYLLLTAFTLGLFGGAHCVGMCGGIMAALSSGMAPGKGRLLPLLLSYNLGRILSYSLAGALMGSLGWALQQQGSLVVTGMRTLAGVMLIAMGLYLANWWRGLVMVERAGALLWKPLQPYASRLLPVQSAGPALLLGLLWGWLPCGLVYSTLIWAATQGSALDAAQLMLAFGSGTLPLMLGAGILSSRLGDVMRNRTTRGLAGMLVILFGLWTLPGGHQQWLMQLFQPLAAGT